MNIKISASHTAWGWEQGALAGVTIVLGSLLAFHAASPVAIAAIAGGIAYLLFSALSVLEPMVFVAVFLIILEIFPPLYLARLGDRPLYLSFFILPVGFLIVICRLPDLHFTWDPLAKGLASFLAGTACSLPFAWWLSGARTGTESLSRWLLLSQIGLVYFLIRGGGRRVEARIEHAIIPLMFLAAGISAAYGIVDFFWPISLPHPPLNQFIWLDATILRRAQGVFYESLNFANFCGVFLVVAAAALLTKRERYLGLPRWLLVSFMAILSLAVLVAFARSTWAATLVAILVFSFQSRLIRVRRVAVILLALGVPLVLLWTFFPELWRYFLDVRVRRLAGLFSDPNLTSSGRFETWLRLLEIMRENPQYLVFGIGYKTLTFTRLFHDEMIADNGYLSLLLETGAIGLGSFLLLSAAIMKTFSRLAREGNDSVAFWSALMLAIWCGELVQLVAVDAYTFWRNMVVLVALMALALNRAERNQKCLY